MTPRTRAILSVTTPLLLQLLSGATAPALAQDRVQACIDDHARGQASEQAGRLRAAQAETLRCSQRECPPLIQKDCAAFLERVTEAIPTFVARAVVDGNETPGVRVSVDGVVLEERLSARPIVVDPGERLVAVDFGSRGTVSRRVLFQRREKDRLLEFVAPPPVLPAASDPGVAPSPDAPLPGGRGRSRPWAYAAGGVSVVAIGSFTFFGLRGLGAESDLEKTCGPPCTRADLQPVRRDYLIADVSLGVGLATAALATWLYLR